MIIEILAWFTVVGLPILGLVAIWFLWRKLFPKTDDAPTPLHDLRYAHTAPPPEYVEPTVTVTTTNDTPEWNSIDEQSFMKEEEVDCRKIVEPGTRVWRVYRSEDHKNWIECEPTLTERSAVNYAEYVKSMYPGNLVQVTDPCGIILIHE
jgi:ABC-type nickel/cobalt efflux system permease component RcnA